MLLGASLVVLGLSAPSIARAAGPNAILTPTGYDTNNTQIPRGDDTANQVVGLPFTMNWNGTNYTQVYINMNGNVTFGSGYTGYNPNPALSTLGQDMMAPFWADVDTRNTTLGNVSYSNITSGSVPTVDGHAAFFVNWIDVGRFNYTTAGNTVTDSFQLVIVDRSDTGAGNFDFMFNYDEIAWDQATSSSTRRARVGWSRADGTAFELPGSGTAQASASALLDTASASTSLIQNSLDSGGQLGRYVWQVRGGVVPNFLPVVSVVDRVLEGNVANGYVGYTGSGDATASDYDGFITSFLSTLPGTLPMGDTQAIWTATDNRGGVTTATQTVTVRDTVPPENPTPWSPTNLTGVWYTTDDVGLRWRSATDTCTGVAGYSYSWSRDVPALPDATIDPSLTTTFTTVVNNQTFDTTPLPSDWTSTSPTYIRMTNVAARTQGTYAVELWANNNTRRSYSFTRAYDLTEYSDATLTFWENVVGFGGGTDYSRVQYSTDGVNFTTLRPDVTASAAWTQRVYPNLPTGSTVWVRFSGSLNRTTEYINWDNISVSGTTTGVDMTSAPGEGTWYFNVRSADNAGNWSTSSNVGPFLIDGTAPVTTSNAPSGWSTSTVNVTLTPTDLGSGVAYTRYKLDAAAVATYTAAVPVSADGTHTLLFWSVDQRGNVESTRTAQIRVDKVAPTTPTVFSASAVSTSSVEVTWTVSTDSISGLFAYGVYRDGSLVATSATTMYTVTGLNPGQTYAFSVAALDVAGNWSARTASKNETLPASEIWMSLSPTSFDFGVMDPGTSSAISSGTVVTVGGVGLLNYDLTCSASDFSNLTTPTTTPTMPIGFMTYATRGWKITPVTPFTTTAALVNTSAGTKYVWQHPYVFDYTLNMPWTYEPGAYTTGVRFTAVPR